MTNDFAAYACDSAVHRIIALVYSGDLWCISPVMVEETLHPSLSAKPAERLSHLVLVHGES